MSTGPRTRPRAEPGGAESATPERAGSPRPALGLDSEDLVRIARTPMPFGKYQGRPLIDLPEAYLLWFAQNGGFPRGTLGRLLELTLVIRIEGLEGLIRPLKHTREPRVEPDELDLPRGGDSRPPAR